ncbi:EF hand [Bremerella volcania]|uniref:EF hand n=1 Tax=Bremerella volcania TaxID=2527984 RepID=A0A518CAB4_9BACT|nr:hypothetical protein [Bremerella volcania]QDU76173.1 EF hand [Bremerella volcania]
MPMIARSSFRLGLLVASLALAILAVDALFAQGPPRGGFSGRPGGGFGGPGGPGGDFRRDRGGDDSDRDRGREESDRDRDRGSDRGDRSRGGFDPAEMLRRMDQDRNGKIEGSELEGRGGEFVRRMLNGTGMENSNSINIEDASKAIQKAREQREAGVESASMSFGASSDAKPAAGFDAPPPVNGKSLEERFGKTVVDQVMGIMSRYDKNKNHYLDGPEWSEVRWRDDPTQDDTNKDGRLSIEELCQRVVRSNGGRSSDRDDSRAENRESGDRGGDDRFRQYAESLLRQNDRNKNGVLEKDEWSRLRGNPADYDKNNDGKITVEELTQRSESYGRGRSSRSASSEQSKQETYRFLTATERLPKGLPDWFLRNDQDADGQIMMHEFSTSWSSSKVSEFNQYDLNGDGVITPKEALDSGKG